MPSPQLAGHLPQSSGQFSQFSPRAVGGSLEIQKNQRLIQLDDLAALRKVGGAVRINANDRLCNTAALALVSQLKAYGFTGTVSILGNRNCVPTSPSISPKLSYTP